MCSKGKTQSHYKEDPLSNNLVWELPANKFMQSRVKYFKEDSNPSSHIMSYRNAMALYNHNDSLMCKMFPFTLKGNSTMWYADLPSGSIMDFKTLSDEFTKAFFAYKEVK